MVYAWDNGSTQNAHIKHSNDNRQKAYMETHRDNKAYAGLWERSKKL